MVYAQKLLNISAFGSGIYTGQMLTWAINTFGPRFIGKVNWYAESVGDNNTKAADIHRTYNMLAATLRIDHEMGVNRSIKAFRQSSDSIKGGFSDWLAATVKESDIVILASGPHFTREDYKFIGKKAPKNKRLEMDILTVEDADRTLLDVGANKLARVMLGLVTRGYKGAIMVIQNPVEEHLALATRISRGAIDPRRIFSIDPHGRRAATLLENKIRIDDYGFTGKVVSAPVVARHRYAMILYDSVVVQTEDGRLWKLNDLRGRNGSRITTFDSTESRRYINDELNAVGTKIMQFSSKEGVNYVGSPLAVVKGLETIACGMQPDNVDVSLISYAPEVDSHLLWPSEIKYLEGGGFIVVPKDLENCSPEGYNRLIDREIQISIDAQKAAVTKYLGGNV